MSTYRCNNEPQEKVREMVGKGYGPLLEEVFFQIPLK